MNRKIIVPLVVVAVMFCSVMASASEDVTEVEKNTDGKDFFQEYIHSHLEIGTRSTGYSFTDDVQGDPFDGSYLGSLNEVHESQNYAPVKVFAQYKLDNNIGFGVAYDQFEAATGSSPKAEDGGDGSFSLKGVYVYLLGSLPNETRFTPFVEVGLVAYGADFAEKSWWYEDGRRVINPDNAVGTVVAIGCDIHVYEQWSIDVYLRRVNVDLDVDYVFMERVHTSGTFTLSHNEYGIGVKYRF